MEKTDIDTLLFLCRSSDPTQQVSAILALIDQRDYKVVSTLVDLLVSPDVAVRYTAAQALGYIGAHEPETAGSALLTILADTEVIVRSKAVEALGILGYKPATGAVKSLLRTDPDPLVRASAAETLGDIGDTQALAELQLAMRDTDETVRAYAANSMGILGTSKLLPKLQTYVETEPSLAVKAELFGARYRLGAAEDLNLLISLLDQIDETLATLILNILADLTERKVPSTLLADAPFICKALTVLSQRIPILYSDAEQIMVQVTKLESEIK